MCHAGKAPLTASVWIVTYTAAHGGKDPSEDDDAGFGGGMVLTWIQGSVVKLKRWDLGSIVEEELTKLAAGLDWGKRNKSRLAHSSGFSKSVDAVALC